MEMRVLGGWKARCRCRYLRSGKKGSCVRRRHRPKTSPRRGRLRRNGRCQRRKVSSICVLRSAGSQSVELHLWFALFDTESPLGRPGKPARCVTQLTAMDTYEGERAQASGEMDSSGWQYGIKCLTLV